MFLHRFVPLILFAATTVAGSDEFSEGDRNEIDSFLASSVQEGKIPGVVAIVVTRKKVLYHQSFGMQNAAAKSKLHNDSVFRIASMTKPITSVAVMQLVEKGKIGLDDPISKYLPNLRTVPVIASEGKTRPAAKPITVRQLLSHTSGYGYWFSNNELERMYRSGGKYFDLELLVHEPGDRWTYGCGTRILGQLIEKVSGRKLDEYLGAHILEPLGMVDTGYRVPAERLPRLVSVYKRETQGIREEKNGDREDGDIAGDYGLRSTALDYSKFLKMLLNEGKFEDGRILGKESVRLMTSNQIGNLRVERHPGADPLWSRSFPIGAGRDKFGLGFQICKRDKPGFRSVGSYSWAGIYNTHFWVDPEKGTAAIVMMQVLPFYDDNCIAVLRGFEERVYQAVR